MDVQIRTAQVIKEFVSLAVFARFFFFFFVREGTRRKSSTFQYFVGKKELFIPISSFPLNYNSQTGVNSLFQLFGLI